MISFESRGWVSIWASLTTEDQDKDVLRDLCGVDYYDVDYQENIAAENWNLTPIRELICKLSYSDSYIEKAVSSAEKKGVREARQVVMQLNFKYDPGKVTKKIMEDPIFLGAFRWSK